jgi:hypothetical protein
MNLTAEPVSYYGKQRTEDSTWIRHLNNAIREIEIVMDSIESAVPNIDHDVVRGLLNTTRTNLSRVRDELLRNITTLRRAADILHKRFK